MVWFGGGRGRGWSVIIVATTLTASRAAGAIEVERNDDAVACPDSVAFAKLATDQGLELTSVPPILVRFERTPNGYASSFRMPDGTTRTLVDRAGSCDGLADATAVALAIALDPGASSSVPTPTRTSEPPVRRAPPEDRPRPADVGRARHAPIAEVSGAGVLSFGITDPVAGGVRLGASYLFGHADWSVGMTAVALPAASRRVNEGTVEVSALGAGVDWCRRFRGASWLWFALCGRAEAMRLEGSAHGFARSKSRSRPLFTGGLLARASVRLAGPIALSAEGGAVLPFVRERFAIDTLGVVYEPSVVGATTALGVVVDFE